MPTINRDDVSIYYEVHGKDNNPPLILTHGYASTSGMWAGQITELSKNYKLILWDMRGHGRTDYPKDPKQYSEEKTVLDMATILDTTGGKNSKAIVGGLSLGGYMSLAFYLKFPERVQALLIIDTGPGFKQDSARNGWNQYANETGDIFEKQGLIYLQTMSPERATVDHRSADGLVMAARGMLTQKDSKVINSLPNIKVPSIIIVGADDKPFLNASEYMVNKIPEAKKVVVPNAGHAVNIDQPQGFLDAILPFLDGLKLKNNSIKSLL